MPDAQNSGGRMEFEIPSGRLLVSGDLSFRCLIRASVRSHDKVLAAVEAASRLSPPVFVQCGGVRHDADGFHLSWPAVRGEVRALPDLVASWRGYPAIHLSDALALARYICRASSELDHLRPLRFLFSPAQICQVTAEFGQRQWVTVPLPLEGAGISDFVSASELSTAWLSGDELLGIASTERAYLLGAVLYYCLVSDLVPGELSRGERIRRCLAFRAGNRATARAVIQSSVPKALAGTGEQLADFICDLLGPGYGRAITPAQAVVELERFQAAFAARRLASLWEAEGNTVRALDILNAFERIADKNDVPWAALERLRRLAGDIAGADDAKRKKPLSAEEKVAESIRDTHRAPLGPEGRAELERKVARVREPAASGMNPEEYLFLVYMNGRFLNRTPESLQLLRREFKVFWHKVICGVLTARFSAERNAWIDVSRACRDSRGIVLAMPNHGGLRGLYALAFFDLLDGIAHIRFVDSGQNPDYLNDACDRLERSVAEIREAGLDDLRAPALSWLRVLAKSAAARPAQQALYQKVEALCRFAGAELPGSPAETLPDLPWFEESRFFATLSERIE